jgi:hypothetical protein
MGRRSLPSDFGAFSDWIKGLDRADLEKCLLTSTGKTSSMAATFAPTLSFIRLY